jgi:long-chain acyl-CoA synthetase
MTPPRGIHDLAAAEPDRVALVLARPGGDETTTFAALEARSNRIAHALAGAGVAPGERVAVALANGVDLFAAWNAAARLGAFVVPVSTRAAPAEIAYLVSDSGARVLIHGGGGAVDRARGEMRSLAGCFAADDPVFAAGPPTPPRQDYLGAPVTWMSYTSGTTGKPKGIERPPPPPLRETPPNPTMAFWGFGRDDVHLLCGPAYHTAPGAYAQMHLVEGATVVALPRWDPRECLRAIATYRVTSSHMVPANFIRLLEVPAAERAGFQLGSVRKILHGAAACPVSVKRRVMELFPDETVWEYYGASEGMGTVISPAEWLRKPGSVGKPFPGLDLRILGDDGAELPAGAIGTIYLRPTKGYEPRYRNAPDKTRAAYQGELFTVGDLGWQDEDGYVYIADRRTDLILRGGVNVYPAEVEGALCEHADVVDAAVFGVADERLGQRVQAMVELRAGAVLDLPALREFLAERLADYKIPAAIEIVATLPREESGKIRKRALAPQTP